MLKSNTSSKTMLGPFDKPDKKKRTNVGRPFRKAADGDDPRRWKVGRPLGFDALRALALELANEPVKNADGKIVVMDGHNVTRVEAILRGWAESDRPELQRAFIEVAYGKVPDKIEVSTKDSTVIYTVMDAPVLEAEVVNESHQQQNRPAAIAQGAVDNRG